MSGPDVLALMGIAFAIPGVLETFIHAGQHPSHKLQYEPEAPEFAKMQDFTASLTRGSMRTTLETLEDMYCDTSDKTSQLRLQEQVREIWGFVLALEQDIDKIKTEGGGKKRGRAIDEALGQVDRIYKLEKSLRNFIQTHVAARSVRSKLELRPNQFTLIGELERLPFSQHSLARVDFRTKSREGQEYCLVEEKMFPGLSAAGAYDAARDLSRVLQYNKPSQRLLELAGFQVLSKGPVFDDRFRLVFPFPPGATKPRSLRDILLDPINKPILRYYRFILPRKIAESVFQVHKHNLVHKSIRPESIILFEIKSDGPQSQLGLPKLLYLERQPGLGDIAESRYNIGHDIYSFGICLLEIGLWDSFLRYDGSNYTLSPLLTSARADWMTRNPAVSATMNSAQIDQQVFIQLADTRLAYEMGEACSKMVIKCLTCLENGFGNVLIFVGSNSHDWDKQGVLFIQEIRREIANACIMGQGIYNNL